MRKPELLSTRLEQPQTSSGVSVVVSQSFGSFIKAHSPAQDTYGMGCYWKETRSRHIRPRHRHRVHDRGSVYHLCARCWTTTCAVNLRVP